MELWKPVGVPRTAKKAQQENKSPSQMTMCQDGSLVAAARARRDVSGGPCLRGAARMLCVATPPCEDEIAAVARCLLFREEASV